MAAQLTWEEETAREEQEKLAAQRREHNARAIAEVVGRYPAPPRSERIRQADQRRRFVVQSGLIDPE